MYSSIINVNNDPDSNIIQKYCNDDIISDFYTKSKSNFIKKKRNLSEPKNLACKNDKLGEGGYGIVFKDDLNILVAKKLISKKNKKIFENEIKYLELLKKSEVRNNVVHYYKSDEIENKYIIYLELCDGNLRDFRKKITKKYNGKFPLYMIQNIMKQINEVMKYLLTKERVSYNDMKPENILYKTIDEEKELYEFKLCDFGLVDKLSKNDITTQISGTGYYMEPEKKKLYDKDIHVYDKELSELYDLGNIMHFLFFGKKFTKTSNKETGEFDELEEEDKINKIEDEDFKFILKNTNTQDVHKIRVDDYFKSNFFKKDRKDLKDGINDNKYFKLKEDEAIEIAKKITKIKNPKQLDYKYDIINEKLSKEVEHFTSYLENNNFYFVCYNNKENQIEIYKENKEKYSIREENEKIKIKKKLENVNDILIYQNYILILSSPICYINIKKDFNQKYIDKKNLFVKFITIEDKKIFVYLNEKNEINTFEIEIKDNEFNIIKEDFIINIENYDEKINNFDCFKTSKNDILIYLFTDNLIQIYNLFNKKLIFNKKQETSPKIKSVLLTEIDNKIYLIYLTKKDTKQLINILKFKYENYNENLIELTEVKEEKEEKIVHHVNSLMEKIKLFNNRTLIIKCPANIQYYDLKDKIFIAYSKYGHNIICDIKPCRHLFYGDCVLGLRYYNPDSKMVNIFHLRDYSYNYYNLKSLVIKKINNEFFNEESNEYIYHLHHLDSREIRLIDRLLFLNKEENEAYKLIETKKKKNL